VAIVVFIVLLLLRPQNAEECTKYSFSIYSLAKRHKASVELERSDTTNGIETVTFCIKLRREHNNASESGIIQQIVCSGVKGKAAKKKKRKEN